MPYVGLMLNTRRGFPMGPNPATPGSYRGDQVLDRFFVALEAAQSGAGASKVEGWTCIFDESGTDVLHRAAAVVIPATSGAATVVINGTSVAANFSSDAPTTAAAAVAAINADSTAKTFVSAHQYVGKLTTASAVAGDKVTICGTTFTAQSAAATLGTEQWDIRTSDTAAGASLANQINAHPNLANLVGAVNSAGVVYVFLLENRAPRTSELLVAGQATVTINNAIGTATGVFVVIAHQAGLLGNCCTLTVTGTGSSAVSLVSGKLGGGTGADGLTHIIESSQR